MQSAMRDASANGGGSAMNSGTSVAINGADDDAKPQGERAAHVEGE